MHVLTKELDKENVLYAAISRVTPAEIVTYSDSKSKFQDVLKEDVAIVGFMCYMPNT